MFLFYKDLKSSQYDTNDTKDTLQFVLMFYLKSTSVKRTMSKPRQISRKDTYILNRQEMTTLNFSFKDVVKLVIWATFIFT